MVCVRNKKIQPAYLMTVLVKLLSYAYQYVLLAFRKIKPLFYFAFTEDHMLARPWVIFFQLKLFRLGAWILFGHVEITSVGCAYEFNLKGRWLSHEHTP
jgi:hypothetical protein